MDNANYTLFSKKKTMMIENLYILNVDTKSKIKMTM